MDGLEAGLLQWCAARHDLAVIRALKIPDDMLAATMASTQKPRARRSRVCGRFSIRHRAFQFRPGSCPA